jgi:hypothetical protein
MGSYLSGYQLVEIDSETGEPVFDNAGQPVASGSPVELGIGRWGRKIVKNRTDILLETERGRRYVYPQFDRRSFTILFRRTPLELEIFRELDEAVGGQRDPFLFIPDMDNPDETIFVRKSPEFDEGTESAVVGSTIESVLGTNIIRLVEYQFVITEEPTGIEISG